MTTLFLKPTTLAHLADMNKLHPPKYKVAINMTLDILSTIDIGRYSNVCYPCPFKTAVWQLLAEFLLSTSCVATELPRSLGAQVACLDAFLEILGSSPLSSNSFEEYGVS